MNLSVNNTKAVIAILGLCSIVFLMAISTITAAAGMPIVTALIFYAVGNGVGAAMKGDTQNLISKKSDQVIEIEAPANVHVVAPEMDADRAEFEKWKAAKAV